MRKPQAPSPVRWGPDATSTAEELLSTTRAIRRRLDLGAPVDEQVLRDCLRLAGQAPSAGDRQPLRWVVVTDPDARAAIGAGYQRAYEDFDSARGQATEEPTRRLRGSSRLLAEQLARVPVLVIACSDEPAPEEATGPVAARFWASVLPAVWSLQLALRSHGLGSCLTTVWLHREAEIRAAARIPDDWTPVALLPVAPITGATVSPAPRREIEEITQWI